ERRGAGVAERRSDGAMGRSGPPSWPGRQWRSPTRPAAATSSARSAAPGSWPANRSRRRCAPPTPLPPATPPSAAPRAWPPTCAGSCWRDERRTDGATGRRGDVPMTRVVEVPAFFDDRAFEGFAAGFGAWPPEERILVDARPATWASPYGLAGLLT